MACIARDCADPKVQLDAYDRIRHTVAVEYVLADTRHDIGRLRETDEAVRRHHEALRAVAADPLRCRDCIRPVSLLECLQRFGIGRPPAELEAR